MAKVDTVLGPIDSGELGFTLMHEHIYAASTGFWRTWPELFGGESLIKRAKERLGEARAEGVRTIVDLTTIDLGRDVELVREVARGSGMQIIVCTGHHIDVSRSMAARSVEELGDLFAREIEEGIDGTGVKAGIIKVAHDHEGITSAGERILRAAVRAHRRTGKPITTHSHAPSRVGDRQADLLEEEGVDPNRVIIGHSDDSTDLDYLKGLLNRGFWLGLDRLPLGPYLPPEFETRVSTVHALIEAGYADRIVLSHDYPVDVAVQREEGREKFNRMNPDHFLFISRRVLPRLQEMGVPKDVTGRIMVENPRRFWENQ